MKYIFSLSLSGICLAMFVFAMQGAAGGEVDFGELLNNQTVAVAEQVETKVAVAVAGAEKALPTEQKKAMTRNEAIRKAVKGRSWEEAKPDVIKILNEYNPNKGGKAKDNVSLKSRGDKAKDVGGITEDEAVAIALKDMPGEMIGVKWKKGSYRVKVWSEAEDATYKIYIDPQSGKVIGRKRK